MKSARGKASVVPGNDHTGRMMVVVDGIVIYVGRPEECERRVAIIVAKNTDPSARDRALERAIYWV